MYWYIHIPEVFFRSTRLGCYMLHSEAPSSNTSSMSTPSRNPSQTAGGWSVEERGAGTICSGPIVACGIVAVVAITAVNNPEANLDAGGFKPEAGNTAVASSLSLLIVLRLMLELLPLLLLLEMDPICENRQL
jgi:hypothetical protein